MTMTQEERRALFHQKAEVGERQNKACREDCDWLKKRYHAREITFGEALSLAWIAGREYGKDHAEELKIFDK